MKKEKTELSLFSAEEYKDWIKSISARYRQCQIKAAVSVNRELISFYWSLGQEIVQREAEKKYGGRFYSTLSRDLKEIIPGVKGFASSNLRYMAKFYSLYTPMIFPQLVEKSGNEKFPQVVGDLSEEDLFVVPWGHHRMIIDRCKDDVGKAVFFVKKTIQNNWSRAVLENFLDTDLYDKEDKSIVVYPDHYYDKNGKRTATEKELLEYTTNVYYVLLTRGIKGAYLYVCDDNLREYL